MAGIDDLKNMVRKGTVQSVDKEKLKARVKFGDKGGIISGELHLVARPIHEVPNWIPKIGDMVICIMIPDGDGEGYILGGVL